MGLATRVLDYGPAWGAFIILIVLVAFAVVGILEHRNEREEAE